MTLMATLKTTENINIGPIGSIGPIGAYKIPISFESRLYNKLKKNYETYNKQFSIIGDICPGDKLARGANKIYYIHKKGEWFLQTKRWFTNQGRQFTFMHLDEDFTDFMKYLDTVLLFIDRPPSRRFFYLADSIKSLVNDIMMGLYNLKSTYPNEKMLLCKIDSIILSLIDFKNSLEEKNKSSE